VHPWNVYDYLALGLSLVMYVYYIKSILNSSARPTVSTWICWLIMDALVLSGMASKHDTSPQLIAYFLGTACIIGVCVQANASLGWKWYDTLCTAMAVVAGTLSVSLSDANYAIGLGLLAMVVGSIPLLYNAWKEPAHEPMMAWIFNLLGAIAAVMSVGQWTLDEASKPLFLVLSILFNIVIARQFLPSRNKLVCQVLLLD
jgi:hypothetical protein